MAGYATKGGKPEVKLELAEKLIECAKLADQIDMWRDGRPMGDQIRSDAYHLQMSAHAEMEMSPELPMTIHVSWKKELEQIANELDEIADGLDSVHLLRARQLREVIKKLLRVARCEPR